MTISKLAIKKKLNMTEKSSIFVQFFLFSRKFRSKICHPKPSHPIPHIEKSDQKNNN